MKKFTCRDIGGVCDEEITGSTAEEVARKSYQHIKAAGDEEHRELKRTIDDMSEGEKDKWMEDFQKTFDAAPDA
jgi:predicted small metal-binding protein